MAKDAFGDEKPAWGAPPRRQQAGRPAGAPWAGAAPTAPGSEALRAPRPPESVVGAWPGGLASGAGAPPPRPPVAGARDFGAPARPGRAPSTVPAAPSGPPLQWLVLAAVSVLVGLVLGVLASGRPLFSVAGWVLAGTVAIALLALFTVSDARRRVADTWHTGRAWTPRAWSAIAVAAVLVVALNAWQFADWVSRR